MTSTSERIALRFSWNEPQTTIFKMARDWGFVFIGLLPSWKSFQMYNPKYVLTLKHELRSNLPGSFCRINKALQIFKIVPQSSVTLMPFYNTCLPCSLWVFDISSASCKPRLQCLLGQVARSSAPLKHHLIHRAATHNETNFWLLGGSGPWKWFWGRAAWHSA